MRNLLIFFLLGSSLQSISQLPFSFNNNTSGRRVVLAYTVVNNAPVSVTIHLPDAVLNPAESIRIFRRPLLADGMPWLQVGALAGGTTSFTDSDVAETEAWEYQLRRAINAGTDAIGYASAVIKYDNSNYRGSMILLADSSLLMPLEAEILQLKKDLTGDGWLVEQINVNRASGWYSGSTVMQVKDKIKAVYDNAPANDKPLVLFMLGHIPMPRSGRDAVAPDDHSQNKGARGADTYYADLDGNYTDTGTYNPGGLVTPLAVNMPGDFKWDQDFIASKLELAFGRVDFADLGISFPTINEVELTRNYLNRLHQYKHVAPGWNMGKKVAFKTGYDNSNDGSYRSLLPIAGIDSVKQYSGSGAFPQWVKDNGPFMIFMQNNTVPDIAEWKAIGMDATVFSSDQSHYGFGDVAEGAGYSKIRALLAADTKNLVNLWTSTGINIFHQPGTGLPFGIACKQIMDHNAGNNILEKPSQAYDTPAWWNRTHFQYHGDPTLRLFQLAPASAPALQINADHILLSWAASPDAAVAGYHIYRSTTEFGKFEKITSNLCTDLFYSINNALPGEWFMIRAIALQTTGSGTFYNASQGIFIQHELNTTAVQLTSFSGQLKNKMVYLRWTSTGKTTAGYFDIEKSNSINRFTVIGTVLAKANTAGEAMYGFMDARPFDGINLYRLRQQELQGSSKYSEIISIMLAKEKQAVIFYNQASRCIEVTLHKLCPGTTLALYDVKGRLIKTERMANGRQASFAVPAIPAAIYLFTISNTEGSHTRRIAMGW